MRMQVHCHKAQKADAGTRLAEGETPLQAVATQPQKEAKFEKEPNEQEQPPLQAQSPATRRPRRARPWPKGTPCQKRVFAGESANRCAKRPERNDGQNKAPK